MKQKFAARIYQIDDGVVLIKQTIKRGEEKSDPYVIDGHCEAHVDPGPEAERRIGAAVVPALRGELQRGNG